MIDPSVLILTNERDFAADDVIRHLLHRGVRLLRLNMEAARTSSVQSWAPLEGQNPKEPPGVVWWRQFQTDDQPATLREVDDVLVERAQWRVWVSTLARPGTLWVNDLWAARRAENKVEQLKSAIQVGFTVPATVVTNDPMEARAFRAVAGPCVVKTLTSAYFSFSDQSFVFTELLDDSTLGAPGWHGTPLIVQKLIVDGLDARVISFGDRCFGAHCRSKGIDWRKTPFEPELWQRWAVPAQIEQACAEYRVQLGLEYAAFDFMLADDSILFLEANQGGEWLFIDRTLDLGISEGLADRLRQMADLSVSSPDR